MLIEILNWLNVIDAFYWSYLGVSFIILSGVYFTVKSKGLQFRVIYNFKSILRSISNEAKNKHSRGINPIKLYFASIGGMIGLGNIVVVITAVVYGGPGVLVWLWIASFAGMIIKYCEIYLGITFRQQNKHHSFDGGSMYYLKEAFNSNILPTMLCIMLCIYGVEVSQFKIITDTVAVSFDLEHQVVTYVLLLLIMFASIGGVLRLANTCVLLMPPFLISYIAMCLWVIIAHYKVLPDVMLNVIKSAFVGHAPIAGFVGSSFIMAVQVGVARAVYSSDIAIGYDSIIQSESSVSSPDIQAKMSIFAQLTDTIICTLSILVVLVTGVWHNAELTDPSQYIIKAFTTHFPFVQYFMAILFFLAGFTTIIAYLTVGIKCAIFLNKKYGKVFYIFYATVAFLSTNYFNQAILITMMSFSGGLLVLLNLSGIMKLRRHIKFPN